MAKPTSLRWCSCSIQAALKLPLESIFTSSAKQQQQRGDDRDKRSHDAKRYFAVVPEGAERQAAQEGKACRHVRPPGRMRCGQAETRQ
ncbi:hypothetical protein G6F50_018449 [Rhizopus delemar]|uniref:Uncharacterized protein n=1 Tax=Rhizopus delemar TaxID=936053 RepID=A0A9P6XN80_9FUNG|nr:hypothetical protein G6F50_018449 [Rhizopus delemar]